MSKHLFALDSLRVLATVAVVVIHVVTNETGPINPWYPQWEWQVREFMVLSLRWVVPVFVMLSGALMLGSTKSESYGDFLKKRFAKIGVPLVAWAVIYWGFFNWVGERSIQEQVRLTLVAGYPAYHLYFLYIIGGLYLVTPLLNRVVNIRQTGWVTLAMLGLSAYWAMNLLWVQQQWHFSGLYAWSFWLPFTGYFLLGYLLKHYPIKQNFALIVWVVCAGLLNWGSFWVKSMYGYTPKGLIFHDYFNPLVIMSAAAVFAWFVGNKNATQLGAMRFIQSLSAASFGIYLMHWIVRHYVFQLIPGVALPWLFVKVVLIFVISYAITWGMLTIPVLRKIVGGW